MKARGLARRPAGWMLTALCLLALAIAQGLVALVPMRWWGRSLGQPGPPGRSLAQGPDFERRLDRREWQIASHVARAAARMPWRVRCLPQAMAGQWLMRLSGLGSSLVIARQRAAGGDGHALHAWMERGGTILIGTCERGDYLPIAAWHGAARAPLVRGPSAEPRG